MLKDRHQKNSRPSDEYIPQYECISKWYDKKTTIQTKQQSKKFGKHEPLKKLRVRHNSF